MKKRYVAPMAEEMSMTEADNIMLTGSSVLDDPATNDVLSADKYDDLFDETDEYAE